MDYNRGIQTMDYRSLQCGLWTGQPAILPGLADIYYDGQPLPQF